MQNWTLIIVSTHITIRSLVVEVIIGYYTHIVCVRVSGNTVFYTVIASTHIDHLQQKSQLGGGGGMGGGLSGIVIPSVSRSRSLISMLNRISRSCCVWMLFIWIHRKEARGYRIYRYFSFKGCISNNSHPINFEDNFLIFETQ